MSDHKLFLLYFVNIDMISEAIITAIVIWDSVNLRRSFLEANFRLIVINDVSGVSTMMNIPINVTVPTPNTSLMTNPASDTARPVITPYLSINDGSLYMMIT